MRRTPSHLSGIEKGKEADMVKQGVLAFFVILGLLCFAGATAAQEEITLALGADVTSADPHYHNLAPNNGLAWHIFDRLVHQDERQRLIPGLAVSWKAVDDTTWEFTLRQGVRFHDGSPFDAQDVAATIRRAPNVPNSPSSFGLYTKAIKEVILVDPHTVRMKTATPHALLPNDLSSIAVISRKHESASTADFNSGKAAVGTGPFRLAEFVLKDKIVLTRNDAYWGPRSEWKQVLFKLITNDSSRVAALLAGDVQMIENVPTTDIQRVKTARDLTVFSTVSNRIIYLHLDSSRDQSPFVADKAGRPMAKNPLKDVRVRWAMSKAINRPAIVERIMSGAAIPAGQLLPEGFFGVSSSLKPEAFDPGGARKLLAEAGYPDGFRLTLHSPNNRYVNDEQIAQAVAQMLTQVGIETRVEAMPAATFFSRGTKLEFSFLLVGWGSGTGETSSPLRSLLATFDKDKGTGAANRGRYSNPKLDALVEQALVTVDDQRREKLLAEASEVGIRDVGIIPLHYQVNYWAARKGLSYVPRADEYTLAHLVRRSAN
jgi:peptide/nickel transport system substrate-binding protein